MESKCVLVEFISRVGKFQIWNILKIRFNFSISRQPCCTWPLDYTRISYNSFKWYSIRSNVHIGINSYFRQFLKRFTKNSFKKSNNKFAKKVSRYSCRDNSSIFSVTAPGTPHSSRNSSTNLSKYSFECVVKKSMS